MYPPVTLNLGNREHNINMQAVKSRITGQMSWLLQQINSSKKGVINVKRHL
jgi:hypothetical protein